jgi:ferrochelatase
MLYLPEPDPGANAAGANPPPAAVVLINLGTPDAPTATAVRRYLAEFLSDPRVVELPRALWWPILHGVVLRTRPRRSAAKYASIWTPAGSPLAVNTAQQALLLRGYLGDRGVQVEVAWAMRYGSPSIASVLATLRGRGIGRIVFVPLYPQYASSTTGSTIDAVHAVLARTRNVPEVRWVKHYHRHPGYIDALRRSVLAFWHGREPGERLLMSFHGVPQQMVDRGDPYESECRETAQLLATALGLPPERWQVAFQSRLGRARWLQPYTAATLVQLARQGTRRIDVICPGFSADCLETLEEIEQEGREEFLAAGGTSFGYVRCLNDAPAFIAALADLVEANLAGWPVRSAVIETALGRARLNPAA